MTQNIYDNEEFFAGYSRLPRSVEGLDGAPEWPALQAMLPDVRGRRVLDLGCGFGWFCRWAREQGAAHVEGIDVSENMLARARATTADAAIVYSRADMERLALPVAAFDLVYSSLALHYVVDLEWLLSEAHQSLVPGGSLVFSVEHPMMHGARHPGLVRRCRGPQDLGRQRLPGRRPPLDGLADQGRDQAAPHAGDLHQPAAAAGLRALPRRRSGGRAPSRSRRSPSLADEHQRPPFLLVAARR